MAGGGDLGGPGGGRAVGADHAALGLGPGDRAALKVDEGAARLLVD